MSFQVYRDQPFNSSTAVDLVDTFTGDGITATFTLVNKTGIRIAATVEFNNTLYYRYNGGFTVSGDSFTLSSIPAADSTGVAPGLNTVTMSAFNVAEVDGLTDPNITEVPFYIGNGTDIYLESYAGLTEDGIKLQFVNLIPISGLADSSWMQLAAAAPDITGGPVSYGVTGAALYTPPIEAFGTVADAALAFATSLTVSSTDTWYSGDYILLNPGESNSETVKMLDQEDNLDGTLTFTTTELNYNHDPAEPVFAAVRKIWGKMTVPTDESIDAPNNFINVVLNIIGLENSRF